MAVVASLRDILDQSRVHYSVVTHRATYTAQGTAAETHTKGKLVAKTIVVKQADKAALVVVPAHHHVDLDALSKLMGGAVWLASEEELRRLFPECELGAMPPFGSLYDLPTWVSEPLAHDEEIVFNAGTHTDLVRMRFGDYARLVGPRVVACSRVAGAPPKLEPKS